MTLNLQQHCKHFITDRPCSFQKKNIKLQCTPRCVHKKRAGKKILIIKLGAIGDVVRTTALLQPLYYAHNKPEIFWLTMKDVAPMLANNQYIKDVLDFESAWTYAADEFDVIINLDLDKLALRLSRMFNAKKKIGFVLDDQGQVVCSNKSAEQWLELSHNDGLKKKNKQTYQQSMLDTVELSSVKPQNARIKIFLSPAEKQLAEKFARENGLAGKRTVVGINTGGGDKWEKKEWTVEHTAKVIEMLVADGSSIVLFGGKKEKLRNMRILSQIRSRHPAMMKYVVDAGTDNSLRQFFALMNVCDAVLTTDSLGLHVALGLGKKVVVLFGPTSVNEVEIYGQGKKILAPVDCTVCYFRSCDKKPSCMDLLKPESVFKALKSLV